MAELDRVRRIGGLDDVQAVLADQIRERAEHADVERVAGLPVVTVVLAHERELVALALAGEMRGELDVRRAHAAALAVAHRAIDAQRAAGPAIDDALRDREAVDREAMESRVVIDRSGSFLVAIEDHLISAPLEMHARDAADLLTGEEPAPVRVPVAERARGDRAEVGRGRERGVAELRGLVATRLEVRRDRVGVRLGDRRIAGRFGAACNQANGEQDPQRHRPGALSAGAYLARRAALQPLPGCGAVTTAGNCNRLGCRPPDVLPASSNERPFVVTSRASRCTARDAIRAWTRGCVSDHRERPLAYRSHLLRAWKLPPPDYVARTTATPLALPSMGELSSTLRRLQSASSLEGAVVELQRDVCRLMHVTDALIVWIDWPRRAAWSVTGKLGEQVQALVTDVAGSGRRSIVGSTLVEPLGRAPARSVLALRRSSGSTFGATELAVIGALAGGIAPVVDRLIASREPQARGSAR